MKVVFNILAIIVVVALCVWGYRYWRQQKIENGGEVSCVRGCLTPEQHDAFLKKNSGGDDPGMINGPVPDKTPSTSPMIDNSATRTAPGSGEVTNQPPAAKPVILPPAPADFPSSKPAPVTTDTTASKSNYTQTSSAGISSGLTSSSIPAHDSIAPNPPNGSAFSGTGQYLLYRQGNLTWELNTSTGRTCIKFATMDEWRKALVLRNGCGHTA